MAEEQPPGQEPEESQRGNVIPTSNVGLGNAAEPVPAEVREPSFMTAVRGYDRRAVDRYVERVNRVIAELQLASSPRAAVRHALEQVGEQTTGILQRARETAEEITSAALAEANEVTGRAKDEADERVASAEREAGHALAAATAQAEEIRTTARTEAEEIVARARAESERLLERARSEAEEHRRRTDQEIESLRAQGEAEVRELQLRISAMSDERREMVSGVRRIAGRLEEVAAEADTPEAAAPDDGEAARGLSPPDSAPPGS